MSTSTSFGSVRLASYDINLCHWSHAHPFSCQVFADALIELYVVVSEEVSRYNFSVVFAGLWVFGTKPFNIISVNSIYYKKILEIKFWFCHLTIYSTFWHKKCTFIREKGTLILSAYSYANSKWYGNGHKHGRKV